jgi:hypothetical protein
VCHPQFFVIDLFFDSVPERSDSLGESNSLKEAIMGVLRDRMIEEMKLRNFSTATQESYVYAVSRLARYHNKSPDQLSKEDIRAFLVTPLRVLLRILRLSSEKLVHFTIYLTRIVKTYY